MSTSSKENTQEIFEDIKKNLTRGVKDRKHAFHTPVISNVDTQGGIDSRVVVLRKFDPANLILNFHTDFRSPKVSNLQKNNKSLFVFYDHKMKIQLRIKTTSSINNQNEKAKEMWDKTRLFSRKCYLTLKDPSSVTEFPEDGIPEHLTGKEPSLEESEQGYKNFTVIRCKIKSIEWLYLAAKGHRRAKFDLETNKNAWMVP